MRIHATFSTFTLHSRAFTRIHATFTLHSPCIHGGVAMKGSPRPFQHARVAAASARVSSVVVGQGEASRCAASRRPATRAASAEPPGRAREGPCTRAAPAARRAARPGGASADAISAQSARAARACGNKDTPRAASIEARKRHDATGTPPGPKARPSPGKSGAAEPVKASTPHRKIHPSRCSTARGRSKRVRLQGQESLGLQAIRPKPYFPPPLLHCPSSPPLLQVRASVALVPLRVRSPGWLHFLRGQ